MTPPVHPPKKRVAGHVKLMFIRDTEIKPEPPVTPIGMGKCTRGVRPPSAMP
jgi:hypothetical protein